MTVGLLCYQNPHDRTSYSGVLFYMKKALEAHPGIILKVLGHYPTRRRGALRRVVDSNAATFQYDANEYDDLDAILAPVASNVLAEIGSKIAQPIIHVTDATPSYLREFYPFESVRNSELTEIETLKHVDRVIYSSQFMADRAKQEFEALQTIPVSVAPYGVNIDELPRHVAEKKPFTPLKMVYVGGNWDRKGGDIAVATLNELNDRRIPCELTIVGPGPAQKIRHPHIKVVGYLSKEKRQDLDRYEKILTKSHILISPTRADCTPMIISEANAFGCPVAITNVGGVSSLVEDGVNGSMLTLEDGAKEWADAVESLTVKHDDYPGLSLSSFQFSQLRLSWTSWAQAMYEHLLEVVRT